MSWLVCGTREGKRALLKDVSRGVLSVAFGVGRFGEEGAEILLQEGLSVVGYNLSDLSRCSKGVEWKVVLASWIKSQCGVSNQWLADHLHMGRASYVSRLICEENRRFRRGRKLWKQLSSAKR